MTKFHHDHITLQPVKTLRTDNCPDGIMGYALSIDCISRDQLKSISTLIEGAMSRGESTHFLNDLIALINNELGE